MNKNELLEPMALITTVTVMKQQEKLTNANLSYTNEDFGKEVEKIKGSPAFERVMLSLTPDQIYNRATKESSLLINDVNNAQKIIDNENEIKGKALNALEDNKKLQKDAVKIPS